MYKALLFLAGFHCTEGGKKTNPPKDFPHGQEDFWEKAQHGCGRAEIFVDPYGSVVYSLE